MRGLVLLLGLSAFACGGPSRSDSEPEDAPVLSDSAPDRRLVVLRRGPLHLEPDEASPGIADLAAGTLLRVVPDTAGAGGWVRVATWDDRRGWLPASRLIEPGLWAHYGEALGGVSPVQLRPAYPVEGGRWAIEAPLGTPGITPASTAWLLGDSARAESIAAIESIENACGGERHRFGVLERVAVAGHYPFLEDGLLAAPSGSRPTATRLTVGSLDPDPALAELARRAGDALAPRGAGHSEPPASIEWAALGETAAWATLSWPFENAAGGQSQLAAALVFRRAGERWEQVGTLAPTPSTAEIPTPAWRPVAAYAVGGAGHPAVLLLEAFEYEGAHLDIWIDRGDGFERIHEGYYWGC